MKSREEKWSKIENEKQEGKNEEWRMKNSDEKK